MVNFSKDAVPAIIPIPVEFLRKTLAQNFPFNAFYCKSSLLILFTAKPKYLNVSLADGRDISSTIIGPFNEGHDLRLVCESGGGKPIPRVTWYNGSSVISGTCVVVIS